MLAVRTADRPYQRGQLARSRLPWCRTPEEGRLSPDPSRYFDIYLTDTAVSWEAVRGAGMAMACPTIRKLGNPTHSTEVCSL